MKDIENMKEKELIEIIEKEKEKEKKKEGILITILINGNKEKKKLILLNYEVKLFFFMSWKIK